MSEKDHKATLWDGPSSSWVPSSAWLTAKRVERNLRSVFHEYISCGGAHQA
jgi:hypothetical protein